MIARDQTELLFFQAEDGIRYLVRSRGLGDVYKRQLEDLPAFPELQDIHVQAQPEHRAPSHVLSDWRPAVSYTHLTLPTSDLV